MYLEFPCDSHVSDWDNLATRLGFTNAQKNGIRRSHTGEVNMHVRMCLQKWKRSEGD